MSVKIEITDSVRFAATVADEIVSLAGQDSNDIISIALAGGSTPGEVYRQFLVEPRVSEMPWDKVRFFLGDERWVPLDDPQSNYFMAKETFLNKKPNAIAHPITGSDPESAAIQYEQLIKTEVGDKFDILLLGMGDDGHTASIFPHSPLLNSDDGKLVGVANHPATGQTRISFTPFLIQNAERVLVLVKGKGKADMLKRVIEGDDSVNELPIKLLWSAKGKVTFFVDGEAAKHLAKT